jgi:pyridoxal phosphate enzyme (YggS family)
MSVEQFKTNLAMVRERIYKAAERSGRQADSVRLVGVTKYVDASVTAQLVEAGCLELGENRPQTLWEKAADLKDPRIVWHLIGHLQRNKVKRTIELASLIHSVDSDRLITAINEAAIESKRTVDVLLEVNVSGDQAKHGYAPDQIDKALDLVARCQNVRVQGLMCMAGLDSEPDEARQEFRRLRELRDSLLTSQPANVNLRDLSMGMSGDFETAIEEGATIVRVGSLLFEKA